MIAAYANGSMLQLSGGFLIAIVATVMAMKG
jgi:hypothetical protein